jgi:DNA primase
LNLSSLDDRARLASLAAPLIEKVQPGILRQMMASHLQGLTGSRLAGTGASLARPEKARSTAQHSLALKRLEQRLFVLLLRCPQVALGAGLPETLEATDPLTVMVGYVRQHPDATGDELLALWMGEPLYEHLCELASRPLMVDDDAALKGEFHEGIQRVAEMRARESRRRILGDLRQDPTLDALRRLQRARQTRPDSSTET